MKLKEMQKRTGLKLAAIIVIGGVLMFTFTGCDKPAEPVAETVAIEEVVEMAPEDGAIAGGLYAEESTLEDGQEEAITEQYTIDFVDAGNEDIVAESDDMVVIPEYERQKMMTVLPDIFNDFTVDSEDFEVLKEIENTDGSKTYLVKIVEDNIVQSVTTQYSVDKETNMAKALFVYQVPAGIETTAEDLGLNFEITVKEDNTVEVNKIVDLYGNDVSDIRYFNGNCIGWSMTKWATATDFEFADEIALSQNLNLYPVMDLTNAAAPDEDLSTGVWVNTYDGTPIRIGNEFDGVEFDSRYQIEYGKLVDKDGIMIVDEETGEVTEAPVSGIGSTEGGSSEATTTESSSGTGSEQSSTVGGAGQTKQPETNPEYIPSSEPNQMDPNEAFGKFGGTFMGSGGGQPVTGTGAGITLQ